MSNHLTDAQYAAFIDRLVECREAEDAAKEDTKLVYAELADAGEDKTAAGLIVRGLRMTAKDRAKANLRDAAVENGFDRYNRGKASHVRVREASIPEHDADGVIIEVAGEQQGAARPQHRSSETTGAVPTKASAGANTGGENVAAHQVQTTTDVLKNDDGKPGDGRLAPISDVESVAPIPEPATIPTAVPLPAEVAVAGDGDSTDSSPDAVPGATNVTPFRTHNPATHFLNSKGLPRLHGCLKAEACGGSARSLCYTCGRHAEQASHQGGAA